MNGQSGNSQNGPGGQGGSNTQNGPGGQGSVNGQGKTNSSPQDGLNKQGGNQQNRS